MKRSENYQSSSRSETVYFQSSTENRFLHNSEQTYSEINTPRGKTINNEDKLCAMTTQVFPQPVVTVSSLQHSTNGFNLDDSLVEPVLSDITMNLIRAAVSTNSRSCGRSMTTLQEMEVAQANNASCKEPQSTFPVQSLVKRPPQALTTSPVMRNTSQLYTDASTDTPEEPVLNFSYSAQTTHYDTPEEPVLNSFTIVKKSNSNFIGNFEDNTLEEPSMLSEYGKLLLKQHSNKTICNETKSSPTNNKLTVTPPLHQVNKVNKDTSHHAKDVFKFLDESIGKTPELSDITKQIMFDCRQANRLVETESISKVNIGCSLDKENIPPLDCLTSQTSQVYEVQQTQLEVFKMPRPSLNQSRSVSADIIYPNRSLNESVHGTHFDRSLLDTSRGVHNLSIAGVGVRRGPACDNSFSQAMLQYSHVPASPMPTPVTSRVVSHFQKQ